MKRIDVTWTDYVLDTLNLWALIFRIAQRQQMINSQVDFIIRKIMGAIDTVYECTHHFSQVAIFSKKCMCFYLVHHCTERYAFNVHTYMHTEAVQTIGYLQVLFFFPNNDWKSHSTNPVGSRFDEWVFCY